MVEDRIERSLVVLRGWEARRPSGSTKDLLHMIHEEMKILEAIAKQKPHLAETMTQMIRRWQQLALRVKLGLN